MATAEKPIIRIRGTNASLALLMTDEDSARKYLEWLSNEEFNAWILQSSNVLNYEGEQEWLSNCPPSERRFSIVVDDLLVGNCSTKTSRDGNTATLGIIIGESHARGRGIGTEVVGMLVDFSFSNLGVHRVELSVMDDNEQAIRCYEKVGFVECGRRHGVHWYHNEWHDVIIMEIMYEDWNERQSKGTE